MASASISVTALRTTRDRKTAESWALVLAASEIPCRLMSSRDGWRLVVAEEDAERSRGQLESYDRENAAKVPDPGPPPSYGPTRAGFVLAAALALFFVVTAGRDRIVPWYSAGAADAGAIVNGELWRLVTALTLHVDAGHVLANAVSAAVFATLVFRALGPGVGSGLLLLAGAGGNLLNAWVHGAGHVSVGASTALFGAIGILCGLQSARRWRIRVRRRGAWLPLAAGLGLLAMLGVAGERTDVSAHLFGLVCGIPLGAIVALTMTGPPGRAVQWILAAGAASLLLAAWGVALQSFYTPT